MQSSVNGFLDFDGGCIPNGERMVIGQSKVNGSFLLHQIMSAALKCHKSVCLVSFIQKFHHYNAVSHKIGIGKGLHSAVGTNQFKFFDGLEELASMFYPAEPTPVPDNAELLGMLKHKILERVSNLKGQSSSQVVLVVDELSVLLSLGFSVSDVCAFFEEVQEAVLEMNTSEDEAHSSVVVLCSCDEEDADSLTLWQMLVHQSTIDVKVTGLQTGYCKDVHGQASMTQRSSTDDLTQTSVTTKTRQFKLTDNNVEFFAAGTSAAVL